MKWHGPLALVKIHSSSVVIDSHVEAGFWIHLVPSLFTLQPNDWISIKELQIA